LTKEREKYSTKLNDETMMGQYQSTSLKILEKLGSPIKKKKKARGRIFRHV
jgi:hypothetical protein